MRKILMTLSILIACISGFAQKTAQEYFNMSSQLYVSNQTEKALYVVSRGCELYESDSALAQLKRVIEKKSDDNQQNENQQNKNKDNQDNNQNQQNQSGQGQDQNGQNNDQQNQNGNQESQQKGNQQQQNDKQEQGEESQDPRQGQKSEDQPKGDKKGQISEIQAEMMLDAINQDDKAVQQRLMLQKQNKRNNTKIEKNW
ncbi:MAG: hypothetical protein MJ198_05815 [Bacteroidales bacterium]|nr:hypothetical protein [Bacteroidales bacterium]